MPPLMMWTVAPLAGGVTPIMPITRTGMPSSVRLPSIAEPAGLIRNICAQHA